ncbi:hypothetical protein [Paenibacillus pectinilyticus]|nr:hypothetical protein [Paenibacillus pectinilyticus]
MKSTKHSIKMWQLFLAVQFLDIIWSIFILLGIEKADVHSTLPGIPLRLTYMPYTHSLFSALLWSGAAYTLYRLVYRWRDAGRSALFIGLAVFSHWILDLIVHDHDLPLIGNRFKMGYGLYQSAIWSFAIEAALLIAGFIMYWSVIGKRKYGMIGVIFTLLLINAFTMWGPSPPSAKFAAVFNFCYYIGVAWWISRLEL